MEHSTTIIERAFELARTGEYFGIVELSKKLRSEGFASVDAHLTGASIRAELKKAGVKARADRAAAALQADAPLQVES